MIFNNICHGCTPLYSTRVSPDSGGFPTRSATRLQTPGAMSSRSAREGPQPLHRRGARAHPLRYWADEVLYVYGF